MWNIQDREKGDDDDDEESLYEDFGVETAPKHISGFRRFLLEEIRGKYDLKELKRNDSKFDCLARTLRDFFKGYPEEKVVLFSYFRGTLHYLSARLREIGIEATVLMGGMAKEDKTEVIEQFKRLPAFVSFSHPEVASEGVDLSILSLSN